jgi:AraC-like DNA-binding protein
MFVHGHNRAGMPSYTSGDRWSMKYDACVECGTKETKHYGKGLCICCYKKLVYKLKKYGFFEKWSEKYDCCIECGRIDRPHKAHGLCGTCYASYLNRKKGRPKRNFGAWSWYYDRCQKCGTTERPHVKSGLCYDCYEYQHKRFKMYFDSDLNLADISKELGMDRHSITRQFIKYFGQEKTQKRNELIRRCNISEKAIINKNYKNMYGTIVEYKSPNQGIVRLRSKLEAKYAKHLDDSNIDWYYEYKSFPYLDSKDIRRTYTPDFYLPVEDKYIEVKGKNLINEKDTHKINWVKQHAELDIEIQTVL